PVAAAYFRGIESEDVASGTSRTSGRLTASANPGPAESDTEMAAVFDILRDAGMLPQPPRALLDAPREGLPRFQEIQRLLQFVHDSNPIRYLRRTQELAFLANTLIAGCSIQARPITAQDASDAVVAICIHG